MGPGLQRHHQHRHLRARAGDLRLHPRGPRRSTSPARSSRRVLDAGAADLRLRRRGLLGGRRHHRGLPQGPPGHPRRPRSRWRSRGSRCGPASGSARGRRSTRRPWSTGRRSSATTARSAAGVVLGEYTTLGSNVRVADERGGPRGRSSTTTATSVPASAWPARSSGARATCARVPAASPARCSARAAWSARRPRCATGVKVYPFKTVEAGAIVNSSIVWESRGSRSLFGRDGVRGIANVDISPELVGAALDGLGVDAGEGDDDHVVAGHQPGRPGAEAGGHGRLQRRRGQRRGPRGGDRAGDPPPHPHLGQPGRRSPSGWPRTTRSR